MEIHADGEFNAIAPGTGLEGCVRSVLLTVKDKRVLKVMQLDRTVYYD